MTGAALLRMPSLLAAKNPNAATTMASSTVLATPRPPLPAISAPASLVPAGPVSRSSLRSKSGITITLSATVRAASTYRSGMFRAAATMTASTAISADWAMYSRM